MAQQPLVSIVVPAWNAEATLAETLRSAAAQTYGNWEIIIVDDGSTDRSREIARAFCEEQQRARLLVKENGGVASARNLGIAEAKGNWIAPIDADDLWHPTKIEKQVAAALGAPERPGFVYCWFREIDERGTILSSGPRWVLSGAAFNRHSYLNVVGNGSAPLLSRQAVLECGGYDPSLRAQKAQGCEDLMLQLLVAQRYPIEAVPEHLVGYRQHQSNMSGDRDEILRSWRLVYERLSITQPAVQRRVLRWMEGHCSFGLAEQAMVRGQYGVAIAQLARAMRLDPLRCGSIGLYRLLRSLRHRIGGRRPPPRPVHFYDADPAAVITNDPDAIERGVELLDRLEMRRLARLGALDRRTSPPAPTRAGS